jgi:hypothetical protein
MLKKRFDLWIFKVVWLFLYFISQVISVKEVFRLQGDDELREAEERYLPGKK